MMNDARATTESRRRRDTFGSDAGDLVPAASEISMSVVTDDTRLFRIRRPFGGSAEDEGMMCGFVNVEPVLFLTSCAIGLLATNSQLFTYWARCIQIGKLESDLTFNVTYTCALLAGTNSTLQDDVERDISTMKIWLQIANSLPTLIISPIIGTWADRKGRKLPLLFSLCGFFFYSILQLCATLTYESVNIYSWFLASELLLGFCGGFATIFTTALTIVTDDCRGKLRPGSSTVPMRIGVAAVIQSIGSLLGSLIISLLAVPAVQNIERHALSYIKSAFVQAALSLIAIIYAIFFVRETHFPKQEGFQYSELDGPMDVNFEPTTSHGTSFIGKFFGMVSSLMEVLTARRPGWSRFCLSFSLLLIFVEFFSMDSALILLYLKRLPFAWDDKLFSYFSLAKGLLTALGMILCPLALTAVHWLGKDSLLIIFALASSALTSFFMAFATTTHEIFITVGFALIMGGLSPAYRSFLPRMVAKEETARLLCIVSIIMAFCPILSSLVFNSIFNATMSWWAGFAFFLGGVFQAAVFFGQIGVHILMRPQWELDKQLDDRRHNQSMVGEGEYYPNRPEDEERSVSNTAVSDVNSTGRVELL
ncbi:unnamed protein product [Caenorhabditis auriculariae]|uniref:Major facilitator superfamily (MFS) profile domain-containing protein n=1 Tax=Caenorhabditis auriculariae TaxID=2777116 RepID=A0A8S1HGZ5_9PELO|nr:unnamed protein product [Caenorhabditis auriculariae]